MQGCGLIAELICTRELIERVRGPAGQDVLIFSRNCGATTATSVQVSVIDKSQDLSAVAKGNAFGGRRPRGSSGPWTFKGMLEVKWEDSRHLELVAHTPLDVFFSNQVAEGVGVSFIPVEPIACGDGSEPSTSVSADACTTGQPADASGAAPDASTTTDAAH
ncbi:MAG: hypothetical protein JWN04_3245 [Myxococcaceae bacterium]|nr:hypothetical protein [Myxococcaceae bacterium]